MCCLWSSGTAKPHDVALTFLHGDAYDAEIDKRSAQTELTHLFQQAFEVDLPKPISLSESRTRLARHVLLTELVIGLGKTIPPSLASVVIASEPGAINACVELARTWRLRRDMRESYVTASKQIEQEFALSQLAFTPEQVVDIKDLKEKLFQLLCRGDSFVSAVLTVLWNG